MVDAHGAIVYKACSLVLRALPPERGKALHLGGRSRRGTPSLPTDPAAKADPVSLELLCPFEFCLKNTMFEMTKIACLHQ